MANGLLYYRTTTSKTTTTADPQNLASGQKLEFTFPTDLLESIQEAYSNNIKRSPIPNQDGTRKVNVQENGLESYTITISGVFKKSPEAGISTLSNNRINEQKCSGRVDNLEKILFQNPSDGALGIGHVRWATHGILQI